MNYQISMEYIYSNNKMTKFNNIEQKQDNTKVDIKIPILPDNSNVITIGKQRIIRKPQAQLNSKGIDLRTDFQKKQDQIYKENLIQQNQKQKDQENALNTLGALTTFIMPSTHIGPLFRNNDKSYTDNWLSGEGTGSSIGNTILDIFTPSVINKSKIFLQNVNNIPRQWTKYIFGSKQTKPLVMDIRPDIIPEELRLKLSLKSEKSDLSEEISKFEKLAFFKKMKGMDSNLSFYDPQNNTLDKFMSSEYVQITPIKGSQLDNYIQSISTKFNIKGNQTAAATTSDHFNPNTVGIHSNRHNVDLLSMDYIHDIDGAFVHEAFSHATDKAVSSMPVKHAPLILPNFVYKIFQKGSTYVPNVYNNIAFPYPGLKILIKGGPDKYYGKGTDKWVEARATLNELRYKLFKENLNGTNFDSITDDDLFRQIGSINRYGQDYYKLYQDMPPRAKKSWAKRIRYALKYLPATAPFTFPIMQSTNESTNKK